MLRFGFLQPLERRMTGTAYLALGFGENPGHVAAVGVMAVEAHSPLERCVVRTARLGFHHFPMAIAAELGRGRREQIRLRRTMAVVAGGAVASQNGFVGKCFHELRFRVGMAREAEFVAAILGHGNIVRSVGIMAGSALAPFERIVDGLAFQGIHGLGMAGSAEITPLFIDQSLELGRVGLMAGKTSLAAVHGSMLEGDLLIFTLMAAYAELVAILDKQFGKLRRMWIVASQAIPFFEWCVFDSTAGFKCLHIVALEAELGTLLGY